MSALSFREEAEVCRLGLLTGLLNKSAVIAFADRLIESQDIIDFAWIEVSLLENGKQVDICSKLASVKGGMDNQLATRAYLGLCLRTYRNDSTSIGQMCTIISKLALNVSSSIEEIPCHFEDTYEMASQGVYGNIDEVHKELDVYLSQYAPYVDAATVI